MTLLLLSFAFIVVCLVFSKCSTGAVPYQEEATVRARSETFSVHLVTPLVKRAQ